MKNWKTTTTGLVTAFFGFVLFSPQYFPPWVIDVAKYAVVGGLAGIGLLAKDYSSHSTVAQVETETVKEDMADASQAKT